MTDIKTVKQSIKSCKSIISECNKKIDEFNEIQTMHVVSAEINGSFIIVRVKDKEDFYVLERKIKDWCIIKKEYSSLAPRIRFVTESADIIQSINPENIILQISLSKRQKDAWESQIKREENNLVYYEKQLANLEEKQKKSVIIPIKEEIEEYEATEEEPVEYSEVFKLDQNFDIE